METITYTARWNDATCGHAHRSTKQASRCLVRMMRRVPMQARPGANGSVVRYHNGIEG